MIQNNIDQFRHILGLSFVQQNIFDMLNTFEISTDSGSVSDGIQEYQAKNNSGCDNITAKPYRF